MKKYILLLVGFILITTLGAATMINTKEVVPVSSHDEKDIHKVYALELPDSIYFAGERVPLEVLDVRERLDRELLVNTYWQSNMMLLLKRIRKPLLRYTP